MSTENNPLIPCDQANMIVSGKCQLPIESPIQPNAIFDENEQELIDELNRNKLDLNEVSEIYNIAKRKTHNLSETLAKYSVLIDQVQVSEELKGEPILSEVERSAFHKLFHTQISYLLFVSQSSIKDLVKQRIAYEVFSDRKQEVLINIQAKINSIRLSNDENEIIKQPYFIEVLAQEDQRETVTKNIISNIKDLEETHTQLLEKVCLVIQHNPKNVIIDTPLEVNPKDVRLNVESATNKIQTLHDSTTLPIYLSIVSSLLVLPLLYANFHGLDLSKYIHLIGVITLCITMGFNYLFLAFTVISGIFSKEYDIRFKVSFLHIAIAVMMFIGLNGIPVEPEASAGLIYVLLIISFTIYLKSLNSLDVRDTYGILFNLLKNQIPKLLDDYESTIENLKNQKGTQ